jgi:hypothetical protein
MSTSMPPPTISARDSQLDAGLRDQFFDDLGTFVSTYANSEDSTDRLNEFCNAASDFASLVRSQMGTSASFDVKALRASVASNLLFDRLEEDKREGIETFCEDCLADDDIPDDTANALQDLKDKYDTLIGHPVGLLTEAEVAGSGPPASDGASKKRRRPREDSDGDEEMGGTDVGRKSGYTRKIAKRRHGTGGASFGE